MNPARSRVWWRALFPFLLAGATIFLYGTDALLRAEFWGEDLTEFFYSSHEQGAASLTTPVYGYHFLLARLIAYFATLFPVVAAPYIYAWASLVVSTLTTAWFSRDGFAWLIPQRWLRILVCWLLAMGPGTGEVFLNLVNLSNVLVFLTLLLLLEQPFKLSWGRILWFALLFLSSGQTVILLPLIVLVGLFSRQRRYFWLLLIMVPLAVVNMIGSHAVNQATGLASYQSFALLPRVLVDNAIGRFLLLPFLGPRLFQYLHDSHGWFFWCGGALGLGALLVIFWRQRTWQTPRVWLLLGACACCLGVYAVVLLTRSYASDQLFRGTIAKQWQHRYSYLSGSVALICWWTLLTRWASACRLRKSMLLPLALLGLTVQALAQTRPNSFYHRADVNWPTRAAELQSLIDQRDQGLLQRPVRIILLDVVHPLEWAPENKRYAMLIKPQ